MDQLYCYPRDISYYPIPKTNSGCKYSRTSGNITVTYISPHPLPFGKWGDISAMLISTRAKQLAEGERRIEFESVFKELKRLGMINASGYQQKHLNQALEAWTTVMVIYEKILDQKKSIRNIPISTEAEIYYGEKKRNGQILLPNKSFITLSDIGYEFFTEKAIPVKAKDIALLPSAIDLRIYIWLVRKLFSIKLDPILIPWELLYEQFGPVPRQLKPRFRRTFISSLNYIQEYLYPKSRFFSDQEKGIVLIPSDPHIKPSSDETILVPSFDAWILKKKDDDLQEQIYQTTDLTKIV